LGGGGRNWSRNKKKKLPGDDQETIWGNGERNQWGWGEAKDGRRSVQRALRLRLKKREGLEKKDRTNGGQASTSTWKIVVHGPTRKGKKKGP